MDHGKAAALLNSGNFIARQDEFDAFASQAPSWGTLDAWSSQYTGRSHMATGAIVAFSALGSTGYLEASIDSDPLPADRRLPKHPHLLASVLTAGSMYELAVAPVPVARRYRNRHRLSSSDFFSFDGRSFVGMGHVYTPSGLLVAPERSLIYRGAIVSAFEDDDPALARGVLLRVMYDYPSRRLMRRWSLLGALESLGALDLPVDYERRRRDTIVVSAGDLLDMWLRTRPEERWARGRYIFRTLTDDPHRRLFIADVSDGRNDEVEIVESEFAPEVGPFSTTHHLDENEPVELSNNQALWRLRP